MAKVSFVGVTQTVPVGGTISGTLVVQSERSIDPSQYRVDLVGEETAFVTQGPPRRHHGERVLGSGRAPEVVGQSQKFLEGSVGWENGGSVAGEFYRLPFAFQLPPDSPPSLRTGGQDYVERRVARIPTMGMFVEYTLKGHVNHPMLPDQIEYQVVHVVPTTPLIGSLPNLRLDDPSRSLTLMVDPILAPVLPGQPVSGFYQVLNPSGVKLETLTISLLRRIDYSAKGIARRVEEPNLAQEIPVPHHEGKFAGQFSIPVPVGLDTIPASQGSLYSSQWVFRAHLKGGLLSEPILVEAPLAPPLAAPGPP